jgi:hypothetical protein
VIHAGLQFLFAENDPDARPTAWPWGRTGRD